jgi:16S rRNA (uracil1498-N3)-methyltransferase
LTSARRFFVEGARDVGSVVEIAGGDAHKLVHVLRLQDGDRIEIVDSTGAAFSAVIELAERVVRARLVEVIAHDDADALQVDVAQAVPKGRRMEFVIEKATELGAAAILPFYSERSVARAVTASKRERWSRLARSAALQCGRREAPAVCEPSGFAQLLERFAQYDRVIFVWELAPQIPLRETLPAALAGARRVLVLIGPEGGFAHHEAEAAREHGAVLLWLGRRILRTDTAAMVVLAVIGAFAS